MSTRRHRVVTNPRPSRSKVVATTGKVSSCRHATFLSSRDLRTMSTEKRYPKAETRLAYPGERLLAATSSTTRKAPSLEAAKLPSSLFHLPASLFVNASALPDPFPGVVGEEVRSLEVEREDDPGPEWRQRLRRNAGRDVMTSSARVDECLVAERLYEIESCCRGSRGNPWSCDY